MRIGSGVALAAMCSIPFAAYYGRQHFAEKKMPAQVHFEQPLKRISPIPFARPRVPVEEVGKFFHIKRDSEKGFIYLQSHESTKGIINYLINQHRMDPESAIEIVNTVDSLTREFNKEAQSLKQVEINVSDLSKALNPATDIDTLIDKQPIGIFPSIIPGFRDYIDSIEKHMELTLNDGFINPISVLPRAIDFMTGHGFPYSLHLEEGMSVVPKSEKLVVYLDKIDGIVKTAPYLEISEPAGEFGPGGISGLIFSAPTVIFTKDTMYFIGFDKNTSIKTEKFDPATEVPERNPLDLLPEDNKTF